MENYLQNLQASQHNFGWIVLLALVLPPIIYGTILFIFLGQFTKLTNSLCRFLDSKSQPSSSPSRQPVTQPQVPSDAAYMPKR